MPKNAGNASLISTVPIDSSLAGLRAAFLEQTEEPKRRAQRLIGSACCFHGSSIGPAGRALNFAASLKATHSDASK
jgi:hypothetical protein